MSSASNIGRRREAARAQGRANYEERRREIQKAAAQLFKQKGFEQTTLNDVAEKLRTDRASLYYYVGGKEQLFQDIVGEAMRVNVSRAEEIRAAGGSAPETLRRLIEALMISYEEHYPILYVVIQENLNHVSPERSGWAREMRAINREYEQILIDVVERGQREGTLRASTPAWLIAYGIIGMVGWTNRWFKPNRRVSTPDPTNAAEVGTAFADILLDGLVADDPPSGSPRRGGAGRRSGSEASASAPSRRPRLD